MAESELSRVRDWLISRTQVWSVSAAPQEEVAALRQLARTGDMRAICEQASRLLALDER